MGQMQGETDERLWKSVNSESKADGGKRPSFDEHLGGGEGEEEGAAVAEFAFGADGAAVGEHDVFGDGETEAGAAGFAGAGLVDAVEALEEAGQVLGGNAGAEILHIKFDAAGRTAAD